MGLIEESLYTRPSGWLWVSCWYPLYPNVGLPENHHAADGKRAIIPVLKRIEIAEHMLSAHGLL